MSKISEPVARRIYRSKCKDHSYGHCAARSGWDANGFHYQMACTGNCQRMERYDLENGLQGQTFQINND